MIRTDDTADRLVGAARIARRRAAVTRCRTGALAVMAAVVVLAMPAYGQLPAATVASVVGSVEVQRDGQGQFQAVTVGSSIFSSDVVRTGPGAFTKLVFADEVVIDLGPSSELTIERTGGGRRPVRSLLRLSQGALEAWIGEAGDASRYEIETPSAVVKPQSTQLIVRYDTTEKATDVVGIEGNVTVQGTTGIIGPGVVVAPGETTRAPLDGFPSPVRPLDPTQANAYAQGLRRIGTGGRDGLDNDNPLVDGRAVNPADHPDAALAAAPAAEGPYLKPVVPGQTLIDTLSPDIRANNQPLPVYRAVPPDHTGLGTPSRSAKQKTPAALLRLADPPSVNNFAHGGLSTLRGHLPRLRLFAARWAVMPLW
jgi:hypothetical protein